MLSKNYSAHCESKRHKKKASMKTVDDGDDDDEDDGASDSAVFHVADGGDMDVIPESNPNPNSDASNEFIPEEDVLPPLSSCAYKATAGGKLYDDINTKFLVHFYVTHRGKIFSREAMDYLLKAFGEPVLRNGWGDVCPNMYYLEKSMSYFIPELQISENIELGFCYFDLEMVAVDFLANTQLTRNYKFRYVEIETMLCILRSRYNPDEEGHICSSDSFHVWMVAFTPILIV
jgi:hypothetical protein